MKFEQHREHLAYQPAAKIKRWHWILGLAIVLAMVLTGGDANAAVCPGDPTALNIYVATTGADANPGTCTKPIKTLQRADTYAKRDRGTRDVSVWVQSGTRIAETVNWTSVRKDAHTRLQCVPPGKCIYNGGGSRLWLTLRTQRGECTNLHVSGFTVTRYVSYGILFLGSRDDHTKWNGCNTITNNVFFENGSKHGRARCPTCKGFGVVDLINSDRNLVIGNWFERNENHRVETEKLHAVYAAHDSDHNILANNWVRYNSGDPFKFRDGSDHNLAVGNHTERSGYRSIFADRPVVKNGEVRSIGNVLRLNSDDHRLHPLGGKYRLYHCRDDCRPGQFSIQGRAPFAMATTVAPVKPKPPPKPQPVRPRPPPSGKGAPNSEQRIRHCKDLYPLDKQNRWEQMLKRSACFSKR